MDREELETTYHALRSCRAVAEKYGVSGETVRRLLKKFGIQRTGWREPKQKAQRKHVTEDDIQQIIDTYKREGSFEATAKEVGWAATTVARYMHLAGVAPGRGGNQTQMKITDEQILEAVKTMTRQQIADKYGVHPENLGRRMRRLGVHALGGIDASNLTCGQAGALVLKEINKERAIVKDTWHFTKACARFIEKHQPGFELIEFKGQRCRLRCKTCGNIVERNRSTIREKGVRCDACYKRMKEAKQRAHAESAFINTLKRLAEKRIPKTCQCCGDVYYSEYATSKWCPRCKRYDRGSYIARANKFGVDYEHGITLRKVCIRDKGICQICGKPVDWHDTSWNGFVGALYPSVDHIKALANGGKHTWDNVQLAHLICNSKKGASC